MFFCCVIFFLYFWPPDLPTFLIMQTFDFELATRVTVADLMHSRERNHSENTKRVNGTFLNHVNCFAGHDPLLSEVDLDFVMGFTDYVLKHVGVASARTYLQKLHALMQDAVWEKYVETNPMPPMRRLLPHANPTRRNYLLRSEVQQLSRTGCLHRSTKMGFLLSCYTGLRLSDIETLRWEHVVMMGEGYCIRKRQVKTHVPVCVPLCSDAVALLQELHPGEPMPNEGPVFKMMSRSVIATDLRQWTTDACIGKHVTFHVARHTFATLCITAGIGIYQVSQFCGHTDVSTTEHYVRMVDDARREAIGLFDKMMAGK